MEAAQCNTSTDKHILENPVDVLFVGAKEFIPPQINNMLIGRGVSCEMVSVRDFSDIAQRVSLAGTAIIDAGGMGLTEQKVLKNIIQKLEDHNIASVLLNCWVDFSSQNFSLLGTLYSATLEELWGRVQANLGHRRKAIKSAETTNTDNTALNEEMIEQLKMAGNVQKDFLPAQLPNSDKFSWHTLYEPAQWVSGDIYDVARLDENHLGFYIADAVGHSMPAALLTMFIKQAIVMRQTRGNKYKIFEPAEVIDNLNKRMAGQKLSGCQFATCCYCLLDTRTMELSFARGGHPYPIVVRANGKIEQLQVRGPLLGVFENAEYMQHKVQLEKGDKVFLFSDGVEPVIGKMKADAKFQFSDGFKAICDKPMANSMEMLAAMIKGHKFSKAEIDDVTIVGLEIN